MVKKHEYRTGRQGRHNAQPYDKSGGSQERQHQAQTAGSGGQQPTQTYHQHTYGQNQAHTQKRADKADKAEKADKADKADRNEKQGGYQQKGQQDYGQRRDVRGDGREGRESIREGGREGKEVREGHQNRDAQQGRNTHRDQRASPSLQSQLSRLGRMKNEETVEDIRADITRLEKEIELEIKEIKSMRLGL